MKPSEFKIIEPYLTLVHRNFYFLKNRPKSSIKFSVFADFDGSPIFVKYEFGKKDPADNMCFCRASHYKYIDW